MDISHATQPRDNIHELPYNRRNPVKNASEVMDKEWLTLLDGRFNQPFVRIIVMVPLPSVCILVRATTAFPESPAPVEAEDGGLA